MKRLTEIVADVLKESHYYYITDLGHYFSSTMGNAPKPKRFTVWDSNTNQPIESSNDIGYLMNKYQIQKVYAYNNNKAT
jgi:hypothetical protein